MKKSLLLAAALIAAAFSAHAVTTVAQEVNRGYVLKRDSMSIGTPHATEALCWTAADAHSEANKRSGNYWCLPYKGRRINYTAAPACPALPAAETRTTQCTAPLEGSWQQGRTYTAVAAPACSVPSAWAPSTAPAGACTTPPPPPTGTVLYLSDCQAGAAAGCTPGSNGNPGTQALPKQNFAGVNHNALPAGSAVLFKRGGAWATDIVTLENPNTTAAAPLTFDAWGTGPAPVIRATGSNLFDTGGNWGNTTNDGGYVLRNLNLQGSPTTDFAFWFAYNVRDVLIENVEISGFRIALNSSEGTPYGVRGITVRNSNIHHNRAMGLLGHYDDLLLEGNLIEANNFSGSIFDHGTYIGGGHNITLRNNRYVRNSVCPTAPCFQGATPDPQLCRGGNMTFHGQIDGLVIEGNTFVQDASAPSCYLMSITQGYTTAEWFRNTVVRNNTMFNGGSAIVAQSAPGILIEGNRIIRTQPIATVGVSIGGQYSGGDEPDSSAIVRNNVVCHRHASAAGGVTSINSPGSTVTGNSVLTGAAASTGVCAP